MKQILLAQNSGFCFGVKQALEKTEREIEQKRCGKTTGALYTWGPLIHNRTVTDALQAQGVHIAAHLEEVAAADTLIVRSHGESKDFFTEAAGRGIHIVDATCPFVKKNPRPSRGGLCRRLSDRDPWRCGASGGARHQWLV